MTAAVVATYVGPIEILRGQRALVWKEVGVPRCFLLAKFDQRGLRCAGRVSVGAALSPRSRAAERWERGIWVDVSLGGHQFPSCHFG